MKNSENTMIERINLKKIDGYKYLYDHYYSSLCSFSSRFIKQKIDAEDVVQDVFMKLWKGDSDFNSTKALTSFLYFSVKNASLNAIRNNSKWPDTDISNTNILNIRIEDKSIEQILIEEEFYRQIYVAINKLSPRRKEIILLSMDGLSNKDISDKTGVSINTIKTLKQKAYSFLREELEFSVFLFFIFLMK